MIQTYSNPDFGDKDNAHTAGRCLANVYLYILNIGLSPEVDNSAMAIIKKQVAEIASQLKFTATDKQVKIAGILTRQFWGDDNVRHAILDDLFGYQLTKEEAMTIEVAAFIKWLNIFQTITDGADGKKIVTHSYPSDVERLLTLVYEEYNTALKAEGFGF